MRAWWFYRWCSDMDFFVDKNSIGEGKNDGNLSLFGGNWNSCVFLRAGEFSATRLSAGCQLARKLAHGRSIAYEQDAVFGQI